MRKVFRKDNETYLTLPSKIRYELQYKDYFCRSIVMFWIALKRNVINYSVFIIFEYWK